MASLSFYIIHQGRNHGIFLGKAKPIGGHNLPPYTVLCIAVKVAVFYQQVIKLTQNYDFYDFPMLAYARKTIHFKNFDKFGYTDIHFT